MPRLIRATLYIALAGSILSACSGGSADTSSVKNDEHGQPGLAKDPSKAPSGNAVALSVQGDAEYTVIIDKSQVLPKDIKIEGLVAIDAQGNRISIPIKSITIKPKTGTIVPKPKNTDRPDCDDQGNNTGC